MNDMAKKAPTVPSITKMAELCGVSRPAFQKWMAHEGWPFGDAPWPATEAEKMRAWQQATLQENRGAEAKSGGSGNASSSLTAAKAQSTIRDVRLKDFKIKTLANELHSVEECQAQQKMLLMNTKMSLTSHVPTDIAQRLSDLERELGRRLSDLEVSSAARDIIERAIMEKLFRPSGVEQ